jgi:photosystem II stability/assembly factor-like uncharacterized protein
MSDKLIPLRGALSFILCLIFACLTVGVRDLLRLRQKASFRLATLDKVQRAREFGLTLTKVDTDGPFDLIEFLSPEIGFAGNREGTFFKTIDGGETWQRAGFVFPVSGTVNTIHFSSEPIGWVLLQQYRGDRKDPALNNAWLLHTNDGGKSWQIQFEASSLALRRISFTGATEGWVVGSRTAKPNSKLLLLHSNDGGKHWSDLSTGAQDFISAFESKVVQSPPDVVVDLVATGTGSAAILTDSGRVLRTDDRGASWQWINSGSVGDGMGLLRIEQGPDGTFRTLVRRGGVEGTVSAFAKSAKDSSFTQDVLPGVYLSETTQLSKSEILACGHMPVFSHSSEPHVHNEGVILYSADDGRSWTTVYQCAEIPRFNAITKTRSGEVWAVGSNGQIIRLTSPS